MQARPAELTVEQDAQPIGSDLAVEARHEMPQVTGAVALDLKALAQLAYCCGALLALAKSRVNANEILV